MLLEDTKPGGCRLVTGLRMILGIHDVGQIEGRFEQAARLACRISNILSDGNLSCASHRTHWMPAASLKVPAIAQSQRDSASVKTEPDIHQKDIRGLDLKHHRGHPIRLGVTRKL